MINILQAHKQKRPEQVGAFCCCRAISCRGCGSAGPVFHHVGVLATGPVARQTGSGRSWTLCARSLAEAGRRVGRVQRAPGLRAARVDLRVPGDDRAAGCRASAAPKNPNHCASVHQHQNRYVARHPQGGPNWPDVQRRRPPVQRQAQQQGDGHGFGLYPDKGLRSQHDCRSYRLRRRETRPGHDLMPDAELKAALHAVRYEACPHGAFFRVAAGLGVRL